jgi:hypothetical protein
MKTIYIAAVLLLLLALVVVQGLCFVAYTCSIDMLLSDRNLSLMAWNLPIVLAIVFLLSWSKSRKKESMNRKAHNKAKQEGTP